MSKESTKNLSEQLFAPRQTSKETSTLSRIACSESSDKKLGWYRVLRRPQWIWQGVDPIEMEAIFSRIANVNSPRTQDHLLDTVIGYRPGNWIYEWSSAANKHHQKARNYLDANQKAEAGEQLMKASTYYSIAAYPHIKGDELAAQAEIQANQLFREAMTCLKVTMKTVPIHYENSTFDANLYLPRMDVLLPTVIVTGGLDTLQSELWCLYRDYLAPAGYAMITLDMPSVGSSRRWALTEDSSRLHQALLQQIRDIPWVDHYQVSILGLRFGGNIAARLGCLEPSRLKSAVSVGGTIHSLFSTPNVMQKLPRMHIDMLASRFGKSGASQATIMSQLSALSLKNQGLLARRKSSVPMLGVSLKGDQLSSELDNQMIAVSSYGGKSLIISEGNLYQGYQRVMTEAVSWIKDSMK